MAPLQGSVTSEKAAVLALELEKGVGSQGMHMTLRYWRRRGSSSSAAASAGDSPADTFLVGLWSTIAADHDLHCFKTLGLHRCIARAMGANTSLGSVCSSQSLSHTLGIPGWRHTSLAVLSSLPSFYLPNLKSGNYFDDFSNFLKKICQSYFSSLSFVLIADHF